ncbi:MAG: tail fiber domain-containing protein [Microcystis sp. M025S2]|uniref:tail fiber domain-containing protein n=1 Tax=unclassified Microcystis TaxID=2643300 RepID=UPI00258796EA|nr:MULTISPECIES: tail fiber domain-containing protein [unclassified Microcystis]MCA2709490.1 tail fiber domain-containing protein [Microcystis sp. M025S2]MCA2760328.1 tail fiber domain-containing protein [Microcystis sp. M145S2]
MPFNPEKKKIGDLVKSQDWNDAIEELVRLEKDKVNRSGNDNITGSLTIDGALSAKEVTFSGALTVNNISVSNNVTISRDLATLGNVSIGTLTPENQDGWNRVLDIKGSEYTKLSIRTDKIDGRVLAHDSGFWGAPGGMIIGTRTDHPLSFATKSATHMTILSNGNVGIGRNNPVAKLDIASATRTGTHPNAVKGLYITGEFNADSNGVEFRKSDATQGIGFGCNTIYAAGSNANQDLGLKAKGTGEVKVYGKLSVTSDLIVAGKVNDRNISADGLKLDNHINTNVTTNPHKTTAADVGALSTTGGTVTGDLKVNGAITPSAGNSENNGIMFPKNPGGGSGDAAWIRYYAREGEATTFEIGTSNDSDDHIALMPNAGNVGIGTTNPQAKLHVNNGNAIISGNVGIGTNDPQAKLDVNGNLLVTSGSLSFGNRNGQLIALWKTSHGIGVQSDTTYFRTSTNFAWYKDGSHNDAALNAGGGTSLMTLDGSGTLKVNGKLSVTGGVIQKGGDPITTTTDLGLYSQSSGSWMRFVTNSGPFKFFSDGGIGTNPRMTLDSSGNLSVTGDFSVSGSVSFSLGARQMLNLWDNAYGIGIQNHTQYFRTNSNFAWYKGGSHNDAALNAGTNGTALMVIKGDGNVGIGTTNPTAKLHVNGGNATINGNATISEQANIGGNAIISGNVGIGTNTPQAKLDVNGSLKVQGDVTVTGKVNGRNISEDGTKLNDHVNNKSNPHGVTATQLGALSLSGGNVTGNVNVNGNVGIGTTNPGANLDVNGTLKVQGAGNVTGNLEVGGSLRFGDRNGQLINLHSTLHGIGVQSDTTYFRTSTNFAWYKGGSHNDAALNAGGGTSLMTLDVSGNLSVLGTISPAGTESNKDLGLKAKGTGKVKIDSSAIITGKVGIGTTDPKAILDVNGDVKVSGAVSFGSSIRQMLNLYGTVHAIGVQYNTKYFRTSGNFAWYKGGSHNDAELNAGGGTSLMTLDGSGTLKVNGAITPSVGNSENNGIMFPKNPGGGGGDAAWIRYYVREGEATTFEIGTSNDSDDHIALMPNAGNVGIGTNNPTKAKVQIEGDQAYKQLEGYAYLVKKKGVHITGYGEDQAAYSLYASDRIIASEINAFSDERIKEIYNRSDSQEDLKTLLQIEVTDYSYRDKIAKGNGQHKKVIGQQIAKVFPQAVSTNTDVVCDIFQFATLSDGWVTLTNHGLKTGERVKLIWGEDKSQIFTIEAVTPDTFQIDLDYCGDILVYGREVNDFHVVDYDALSMLHISATQELYKIIKKLEEKINEKVKG